MYSLWIYSSFLLITVAGNNIERASYCYGDNSAGSNAVNITCTTGSVYINDVIAAVKPSSLNCAAEDHVGTPAPYEKCCSYNSSDCMASFTGSWDAFRGCIGKVSCSGVPVIRDEPSCTHGTFPRFSNYMILEYYCMPPGYLFGPCSTSADCNDPAAMCNKTHCACQTGYTTFYAFDDCWRDGGLNGSCTGPVGCQDSNTYCNFTSGRCACDVNHIAYNGSCVTGGYIGGNCTSTADCREPNSLCDKSVCVCDSGYTAFADFDDCWKDGGLNGSCTVSSSCHDNNTECDTTINRCFCSQGYSPYKGVCYADGDLHGVCTADSDCADDNTECTSQRCECIDAYRDIGGICRQDGRLKGYCEAGVIECGDNNATCQESNGICVCIADFTDINDVCKKDGDLDGICVLDSDCTNDHAECVLLQSNPTLSVCACINGYTYIDGTCIEDGDLHGLCTADSDCVDDNTKCTRQRCECIDDYRDIGGICRQDGRLKGYCEAGVIECGDNNATCQESNGICVCIADFTDINDVCKKDGDLDGICVLDSDCTNDRAECVLLQSNPTLSVCACINGYTNIDGTCIEDGDLHGLCTADSDCVDDNTKCTRQRCECIDDYRDIGGICRQDGRLKGYCEAGVIECGDNNATCQASNGICVCIADFTDINDVCKKDGDLHGLCTADSDCVDDNTKCTRQRCECIDDYRDIGGICRQDGRLKGYCEAGVIECGDNNATCQGSNGICVCIADFTDINDVCKKDGDLDGICVLDSDCTNDHAECVTLQSNPTLSVCACINGYTNIDGTCIEDGTLFGVCTGTIDCTDNNTECDSSTGRCVCLSGYSSYNRVCYADGDLHGLCKSDSDCVDDNTTCVSQRCECITDYRDIGGVCREDRRLYGFCDINNDCLDDNTECSGGVCICVSGHRVIQDACIKDGDIGGACTVSSDCDDDNAQCVTLSSNTAISVCECKTNYKNMNGQCKEDRRLGGWCSSSSSCLDANTNCSTGGICTCIAGYSEVNNTCARDEMEGGVCGQSSHGNQIGKCSGDHTVCTADTQSQCGGSNCIPGLCRCKQGYSIGADSSCTKDGDIDGRCTVTSDCIDANAECSGTPSYCTCSNGYRNVDRDCVKDGDLGGYCIVGNMCTDPHSICVNGTCICNDVRNYVNKNGVCEREDSYVSGECRRNGCLDTNSECVGNKCVCKQGFSQHNGVCTFGDTSSVTSCDGNSPYNQLVPDCDKDSSPIILEQYERVKSSSQNCPGNLDVYSDTIFTPCCSYAATDCRLGGSGADACTTADLTGSYTTYNVIDYICAKEDSVVDATTNDDVTSRPVYVTISEDNAGITGVHICSVTASCQTDLFVYLVFSSLEKINNQCSKTLTIIEGTESQTFDSDNNVANATSAAFSTSSGFFLIRVDTYNQGSRFLFKIDAGHETAGIDVACGNESVTEGPTSYQTCGPAAGRLGGECSAKIECVDPHTTCLNGICVCIDGFSSSNMKCLESATEDKTGKTAMLAVIIPVVVLVVIAIFAALFWFLKDTIRKRFCPKPEPASPIKPVLEGPNPMNVKYTGSGVPADVNVPKAMPPPWMNTGWTPSKEKFRGNLPNDPNPRKTLPPIIRPPVVPGTPMNTKFSRTNGAGEMNMADYLFKEELGPENNLNKKKHKRPKRNSVSPTEIQPNTVEGKPKGKKHKKFRKAQLGIKAKQAFELPHKLGNTQEGVYTPHQDYFNQNPGMNSMNGTPRFNPNHSGSFMSPNGHLPPLNNTIGRQPLLNSQTSSNSFDPRSTWRTVGAVTSVVVQPKVRRPSVIDIASVDDPFDVEHTQLN